MKHAESRDCWCSPTVDVYEGADVIVHNDDASVALLERTEMIGFLSVQRDYIQGLANSSQISTVGWVMFMLRKMEKIIKVIESATDDQIIESIVRDVYDDEVGK